MNVTLRDIVKRFGNTTVVNRVSLDIPNGAMFFLLGPSGCGKTTILRMVAGFFPPDDGSIEFSGRRMNRVPPNQRNTALVFQNYAIWPHLSVFENVAYGLRVRRVHGDELRRRVGEALAQVRMDHLRDRKPAQLSGGQQQRVALARAMVVRPDVLLFDEPLSNLDAKLRLEMRDEIRRIHAASKTTAIYVTHDQEEALSLADRIAVMHDGVIRQTGAPADIYDKPNSPFVASFIGEINLFDPGSPMAGLVNAPADRPFGFRPERVLLGGEGHTAEVESATYLGNKVVLELTTGNTRFKAWSPAPARPGDKLRFRVPPEHVLAFPP